MKKSKLLFFSGRKKTTGYLLFYVLMTIQRNALTKNRIITFQKVESDLWNILAKLGFFGQKSKKLKD